MYTKPTRTIIYSLFLSVFMLAPAHAAERDIDGAVHVSWEGSPSPNVMGYHVYRSPSSSGPFTRITSTLISSLGYVDTAVTDGQTYYYASTAVDSRGRESRLAPSNAVVVDVDTDAPMILDHAPAASQGLLLGDGSTFGRMVPAASGIYARIWDDHAVDLDALSFVALVNGTVVAGDTTIHPVVDGNPSDVYVRFAPAQPFPYDATVLVGIDASDVRGNGMGTYNFSFQVESAAQNAAAAAAAPETTVTVLDDGTRVLRMQGVAARIPASETQQVSFGPVDAIVDAHLHEIQFYNEPVILRIKLTRQERRQRRRIRVLRLNEDPTIGWQEATVGDGWLLKKKVRRKNLILQVTHSAPIAIVLNGAGDRAGEKF